MVPCATSSAPSTPTAGGNFMSALASTLCAETALAIGSETWVRISSTSDDLMWPCSFSRRSK